MKLHLDIKMYHSDIKRVKRFGPPGDDGLPKNLSVTFYNSQLKEDLMRLKGRLRPGPVFFREHLTQHQNGILIEAKRAKRNNLLHNVWTSGGQVMGAELMESRPVLIHDLETFTKANDKADIKAGRIPVQPDSDGFRQPRRTWPAQPIRRGDDDPLHTANKYDPLHENMDTQPHVPDQPVPQPQSDCNPMGYSQQQLPGTQQGQKPPNATSGVGQQQQQHQSGTTSQQAGGFPQLQERQHDHHQQQSKPHQSFNPHPHDHFQQPPGYENVQQNVYHRDGPYHGTQHSVTPSLRGRGRGTTIFDRRQACQSENEKRYGGTNGNTPARAELVLCLTTHFW